MELALLVPWCPAPAGVVISLGASGPDRRGMEVRTSITSDVPTVAGRLAADGENTAGFVWREGAKSYIRRRGREFSGLDEASPASLLRHRTLFLLAIVRVSWSLTRTTSAGSPSCSQGCGLSIARRSLASSPPQMWGDGYQIRLRRIPSVRCRRGDLGNGRRRRRRGRQRRSWGVSFLQELARLGARLGVRKSSGRIFSGRPGRR